MSVRPQPPTRPSTGSASILQLARKAQAFKSQSQHPAPPTARHDKEIDENEDEEEEEDGDDEEVMQHVGSTTGGQNGNTMMVKVIAMAAATSGGKIEGASRVSAMPITSLQLPIENRATFWTTTKLGDIRMRLSGVLREKQTFTFCSDDCAVVSSEDLTLEAYVKTLLRQVSQDTNAMNIYIAATKEPTAKQSSTLLTPPFVIKFIQMGESASIAMNTGSLHSSAFRGQDPSSLPMGEMRRMIAKMSSAAGVHSFCALDGSAAGDELTLSQYLALDNEGVSETEGTPSVIVRYRRTDAKVSAAASKFHGASAEVLATMEQMRPDLTFKDHSAEEMHADKTGFKIQEELDASHFAAVDANPLKYTSQMDEADWDSVLRNCCLLYGWKINKKTDTVERATTPAFRLKNKNTVAPVMASQPMVAQPVQQQPTAVSGRQDSSSKALPSSSDAGTTAETKVSAEHTPITSVTGSEAPDSTDNTEATVATAPLALRAEHIGATIPAKVGAIPSYAINDRSKIQITTVTSEFQESMAKNHFSSTTVEAQVSGGYGGYSVGVSAGAASESSNKNVSSNKTFSKRLIGSYMFPRVSVFLRSKDLEPTDELRQALMTVGKTTDINDLRQLYATFGHLFCHAVTLGGSLQTTKIVTGEENVSDSAQKESFKGSVGAAVSTPFSIGGSVKTSHESSDAKEDFKRKMNSSESIAFEATGGNSILAANPPAWSGSVADFNNWRVIDQNELTPLADAIAGIAGYLNVKQWFLSAVPKLSQYVVIPQSRTIHVRFKVANQGDAFTRIAGRSEQAYLGVDPQRPPKPIRTNLERRAPETQIHEDVQWNFIFPSVDLSYTTRQVDVQKMDAIFYPYSTQAPVLMFPAGKEIGTKQDKGLTQTVWRLEVAQGYSLGPDCLVSIKSCAPVRSSPDKAPSQVDLALCVYRNAQGVFMPAITSSDEPCYWRIKRLDSSTFSTKDRFRHGEVFRLTWSFADQASGFRDYCEDTYGRRSFQRPTDYPSETLTLKMPYPRFENTSDNAGISLVMSPAIIQNPIVQRIKVRATPDEGGGPDKEINYNLHDLSFRLDYVGSDGAGDSGDFMNVVTDAHEERMMVHSWSGYTGSPYGLLPIGSPEAMLAGILLGPAALPIMGIGSLLDGIIGF